MNEQYSWLAQILLAHLLTDFLLQPRKWIESRKEKHFASPHLYLHGGLTALVAFILTGCTYWVTALIILITHTAIDGWKSYQKENANYFLIDQVLHILVILGCWFVNFFNFALLKEAWTSLQGNSHFWIILTAFVLLTTPSGILIGLLTKKWRNRIPDAESLASAGKWIGIIERTLILIMVIQGKYEAIGLLIAAKSLLRFNENNRTETKTEYLLIGSLISIALAIIAGLAVVFLTSQCN